MDTFPHFTVLCEVQPNRMTGHHWMQGMFAAFGSSIRSLSEIESAQLPDVMPTVLCSIGVPSPIRTFILKPSGNHDKPNGI
jgi:hypothetical protein